MSISSIAKGLVGAVAFVAVTGFYLSQGEAGSDTDAITGNEVAFEPPVEIRAMVAMEDVINRARVRTEEEKVEAINRFVNLIPYVPDQDMWGKEDHWSMPYEFLQTGSGDSEDFALAKFYALWAAGVPVERMTLAVSLHPLIDEEHIVLLVHLEGEEQPRVLDSLTYDLHYLDDRPELLVSRELESEPLLPRLQHNREQLLDVVINWRLSQGQDVIAQFSL